MPDLDDLQDRFEVLRSTAGRAQLAAPDTLRARGEARTRRNRLAGTALAVAVLAVGTGSALALTGVDNDTLRPAPLATAPSATDNPSRTLPAPSSAATPSVPVPPAPTSPVATGRAAPPTTAVPAPRTPKLTVHLVLTSAPGDPAVRYRATVSGLVSQLWGTEPGSATALPGPDQLLNTRVDLGNGTTDGSDGGAVACHSGAAVLPTTGTFTQPVFADGSGPVYAPGTYTITFRASYCGTNARVLTAQDSVTFTIPAPASSASSTPAQ